MKVTTVTTLLITVILFLPYNLHAQVYDASSIWINVYAHNNIFDNLTFGNRIGNTFGLDTNASYPFGYREQTLGIWDFWIVYWQRIRQGQFGTVTGVLDRDFRGYSDPFQRDTFKLYFYEIHNPTISFKWPDPTYLRVHCDSLTLMYVDTTGPVFINMFEQDTLALATPQDRNIFNVWIYKTGVHFIETGVEDGILPTTFSLSQNYPNPFNPETEIQYSVDSRQYVSIKIYDMLGREMATLVDEEKPTGEYSVRWDAVGVPSGVYFYKLQTNTFVDVKKMVLVR